MSVVRPGPAATRPPVCVEALATIGALRFPVVLFDLDGTVVDSGGIILASMRHAAETVLGGSYSDEQLLAPSAGRGSRRRWRRSTRTRVDELVRVYRAHNEPLHDTLELCAGMDARPRDAEGRRAARSGS